MPIQTSPVTSHPKKSHKGLIITLVSIGVGVFIVIPAIVLVLAALIAPSARLCSGIYSQGQDEKHGLSNVFTIESYGYSCIGGDAPTSQNQQVTIQATSKKLYSSRAELTQSIMSELSTIGWSSITPAYGTTSQSDTTLNQNAVYYRRDGYTLRLDVYSYDPVLIRTSITMDDPSVNFGIVSDKTPKNIPSTYRPDATLYTSVPMYISSYVPVGFKDWTIPSTSTDSIYRNIPLVSSDSYLVAADNSGTLVLQTAHVPAGYDVTSKCDIQVQDHEYTCAPIGILKDGTVVYSASDAEMKTADRAVAMINGYLVYLGDSNNRFSSVKSQLPISTDAIINVYNQLTYTNLPAKY
ncbi:MAG TPA: hypothetical protein VIM31_02360 [Candidatus Microsaccharimonas sp.]|jgi:hypothetical protein